MQTSLFTKFQAVGAKKFAGTEFRFPSGLLLEYGRAAGQECTSTKPLEIVGIMLTIPDW